ncbi:MAG: BlaI/MecI/CopY family transcriptional regulator, partial [Flavobacteriales bacterium]|nr:BlaI/MecI/CopY family transcriptional regulator [Flavobacteriales bacterium]
DLSDPKPAYTTVSTIVRILERKGFVGHEAFGRSHRYHALVKREQYMDRTMGQLVRDHFGGSHKDLVSFFLERKEIDLKDLEGLLNTLKKKR